MCDFNEEQGRLIEQNEGRLFYFIYQHVHQLNQLLKCRICLEIYENPTTVFNCLHVFCKQCVQIYLQHSDIENPPCPICRIPMLTDKLSTNNFLSAVINFITTANIQLDTLSNCDVSDLLSFQETMAKIKEKNKTEASNVLDKFVISKAISSPDFNLLLNARKILIGPDNNVISTVDELPPVQSINFRDGSVKTPLTKKRPCNKKLTTSLNVSSKDQFDILKESPIENPLFKRRVNTTLKTYIPQRKTENNTKIIPFEDDTNRINVVKWLQNSQNKFEYKPQTPEKNTYNESELQSDFDMPSVSQRHNHKSSSPHLLLTSYIDKQKAEQSKIREKNKIIARLGRGNSKKKHTNGDRRARSLEACIKTTKTLPQIKRHSIGVFEDSKENFAIEQFNSEEENLLNSLSKQPIKKADFIDLVEKECLNEIETELLQKNENKPQRTRRGKANKSDTSGWTRIKEFKKALRRTERKPGKLTLTGVSRTSVVSRNTEKSEDLNKIQKGKGKRRIQSKTVEPVVILENIDLTASVSKIKKSKGQNILNYNTNLCNNSSINDNNVVRVYDLNTLESYISNNIKKVSCRGLQTSDSPQATENLQVDVNKNLRQTRSNSKQINKSIALNNELQLHAEPSTSSNNKGDIYLRSRSIKKINESQQSTPKSRKKLFDDQPKDNSNKISIQPLSAAEKVGTSLEQPIIIESIKENQIQINLNDRNDSKTSKSHQENDSEDELFIKPTQLTAENSSTKRLPVDLMLDDDEDEIFKVPTQLIINPHANNITINKSPNTLLKQKVQTLNEILATFSILNDDNQNKSNFISVLKDIDQLIQFKGQQEYTVDVQVQTNDPKEFFSQNVTTQTASPEKKHNVAIQTDVCSSPGGFQISSTEMFKTQPVINTYVQTDDLACPKCNCVIKNSTEPVIFNDSKNLTGKYVLSGSFDNINFETQDIIKGRNIRNLSLLKNLKVTQNSAFKSFNSSNKENLTKQLNSTTPEKSNLTDSKNLSLNNTNKLQSKKTFKRIRKPSSDSESDETAIKVVKKNKFIEDDICIHFESQLQDEISQPNNKTIAVKASVLSENNEGFNYQECLNNAPKRPDQEQSSVKKRISETPKQPSTKRSKTEDMIRECEMIIQEACSGAIRIENTEGSTINLNKANELESFKLTANVLEEFQYNFSGNSKQVDNPIYNDKLVIAKEHDSEKSAQSKNKLSESLFASVNISNSDETSSHNIKEDRIDLPQKINDDKDIILPSLEDDLMEVFDEFNNPFESDTEDTVKENVNQNGAKIKVLENITIHKNNTINNILQPMEETGIDLNNDKASVKSEDMFLSDSDVVETTPEKKKPVPLEKLTLLSQAYFNPGLPLPVKESPDIISSLDPSPLSCLNVVVMPPPEFQDPFSEKTEVIPTLKTNASCNNINSETDVILIENANNQDKNITENPPPSSSLTPDILLLPQNVPVTYDPPNTKHSIVTSTPYSNRSQIISIRSLNISPILEEDNVEIKDTVVNPIQAAQNSKFSPLTIVRTTTPPPQRLSLITSTPKQKSILNYVQSNDNAKTKLCSQLSQKSTRDLSMNKKPCIACTRMNEEQLFSITSLANKKLVTYSNVFSPSVTHMIVDVNKNNHVKDHTMKFVCAVASGIWIVGYNWVEESLKQGRLLPEEPFEALDVSGIAGPKKSRITRLNKPLLRGYRIHAAPPFLSTTQKEVENVIKLLGGEVVPRPDELLLNDGKIQLIITEAKGSDDFDLYETWLQTLKVVTVDLEWLSRSVGQYETLTLRPFTLCCEDNINNLGYPEELLVEIQSSFMQDVNTL